MVHGFEVVRGARRRIVSRSRRAISAPTLNLRRLTFCALSSDGLYSSPSSFAVSCKYRDLTRWERVYLVSFHGETGFATRRLWVYFYCRCLYFSSGEKRRPLICFRRALCDPSSMSVPFESRSNGSLVIFRFIHARYLKLFVMVTGQRELAAVTCIHLYVSTESCLFTVDASVELCVCVCWKTAKTKEGCMLWTPRVFFILS